MKINVDLPPDETELLVGMFVERITEHREVARMKHACGEMPDAELKWHLSHADYTQSLYEKLFGTPY